MSIAPPDPELYRDLVRRALAEDIGAGDLTTEATIGARQRAHGVLLARVPCVLAGLPVAAEVFRQVHRAVEVRPRCADGDVCGRGDVVAEIAGPARALLTAERTALNFLQRLSGIATLTRRFVEAAGGRVAVLDTRKTTPTLRVLEKYAVRCGGGTNHRMALDDGILIKENHIRLAGGIVEAVRRVRAAGLQRPIEVEAQSLDDVDAALASGAEIVLLDNLSLEDLREAVERIRGRARIEVSGGVTLDRLPAIAALGVDCVSVGALTHSAP
ncbi:MAG TPA: carboxylating nicotinate-nucleotide diphosphorylase, partial [Vicinamibacterales bacterium]|nr:carboxylating nicotinate-nucleotide diphosphorylase [Vicinamibacterales bacterium]